MPDSNPKHSSVAAPLVTPDWLAARLDDRGLLILDIRSVVDGGARKAYETGHIPGAVYTDYAKDGWRVAKGMASGLLPDPAALSKLLDRIGLIPQHHAVIVSAGTTVGDFSAAARVYWTLKIAGHDNTSILAGGMVAWRRDPLRAIEAGPGRPPAPSPAYPIALVPELRAELDAVQAAISGRTAVLLDSRATSFFEGGAKSPQALRAGRLPGAVQLDHALAFDADAMALKPKAELEKLFAGIPGTPVINYCNTGHQAATNWFVLSEVLGRRGVSLYDGSMSEWTEEPSRPVATGAAETEIRPSPTDESNGCDVALWPSTAVEILPSPLAGEGMSMVRQCIKGGGLLRDKASCEEAPSPILCCCNIVHALSRRGPRGERAKSRRLARGSTMRRSFARTQHYSVLRGVGSSPKIRAAFSPRMLRFAVSVRNGRS
jgi:thiosulfate/3-mercaptopyruvate sulfurtransferase